MVVLPFILHTQSELVPIRLGGVASATAAVAYSQMKTMPQVYGAISWESLNIMVLPCIRKLICGSSEAVEFGVTLALIANLETFVQFVAPFAWGHLFSATVAAGVPQVPFYTMLGLASVFVCLSFTMLQAPKHMESEPRSQPAARLSEDGGRNELVDPLIAAES